MGAAAEWAKRLMDRADGLKLRAEQAAVELYVGHPPASPAAAISARASPLALLLLRLSLPSLVCQVTRPTFFSCTHTYIPHARPTGRLAAR